jgi:pimeloyl-ACP methyl ester carboxylesterase
MKTRLSVVGIFVIAVLALYYVFPGLMLGPARNYVRGVAGFEQKEAMSGGERIVYLEGGSGEPVVLLHGLGGNKDAWDGFARIITPSNRVFALDLPGFGDSARSDGADYGYAAQVERIEALLATLHLPKVHLVGHSMGGAIAALFAAAHPTAVMSLTLIAPTGIRTPEKSEYAKLLERREDPLRMGSVADYDRLLGFLFEIPPAIPGIVQRALAKEAIRNDPFNRAVGEKLFGGDPALLGIVEPRLPSLVMPSLVIWCDHDRVNHPSGAEVLRRGLPRATVRVMRACGHLPQTEQPDETGRLYHDFLSEIRLSNEGGGKN